jgi:hypothetical protein
MSYQQSCEFRGPQLIKNPFSGNIENPGVTEVRPEQNNQQYIVVPISQKEVKIETVPSSSPIETVIENKITTIKQDKIANAINNLFENPGFGVEFFTIESSMLPAQALKYNTETNAEQTFDQTTFQKEDIVTSPVSNILYPKNIYNKFPIDAIAPNGGWINKQTLVELGAYSPKLNFLITFIQQRPNYRHFISTAYLERFGADLVTALLEVAGFSPLILCHNFRDSGGRQLGSKSKQHLEIQKVFNTNRKFNVLVSNTYGLEQNLVDIDYYHILENINYDKFIKISSRIYKSSNYSVKKPLKIVYHIANLDNGEKASDFKNLEKFVNDLNEKIQIGIRVR